MVKIGFDKTKINKIIIFSPNWLGDTVISTALVSSIKKEFPSSLIVIAANKYVYPLWAGNPLVSEILRCEVRGVEGIISYVKLLLKLKKYRFDLAIILPHCFRYALFSFLAGIPLRAAYNVGYRKALLTHSLDYTDSLRAEHILENYLAVLDSIGIKLRERKLFLNVKPENGKKADDLLKANKIKSERLIIGIGPGAVYGEAKRWPKERFAELITLLGKEERAHIFVFTGTGEKILGDWLRRHTENPSVVFIHDYPLAEVMSLIKRCALFIGNDSGLGHIAAALDIKTISIFGSTSPRWTAPCGKNNITIYKQLSCSPCFTRKCRLGHCFCLASISAGEVMEAVSAQLKN